MKFPSAIQILEVMKFKIITLIHILLQTSTLFQSRSATSPSNILHSDHRLSVSVTDYGASADARRYDTVPIQSAIDNCSSASIEVGRPCLVDFPPGKYLTATVYLKSGVVLNVSRGATILGGTRLEDYPEEQERWYVVVAEGAAGVGITGGGEINGQGLAFVERFEERKNVMVSWNRTGACLGDECKPRLVGFIDSRDVRVWDVHFKHPAYWWYAVLSLLYLHFSFFFLKYNTI